MRILPILFYLTILLGSCHQTKKEQIGKPTIVTTTGMIYDAVRQIGGDYVSAVSLMGPGVDPHLYKATQGDLQKLQSADLILYNGLHLEGKMGEVFEKLGRIKKVKAVSADISKDRLRASQLYANAHDPHIWFDVKLWQEAVVFVKKSLIEIDSIHQDVYEQNTLRYLKQLDSLHQSTINAIASIPESQRLLITAHDAFGYFGDAYNIRVEGLQGISTLAEPGLKDITVLVDLIVESGVKAVFIETSVSERAINAVIEGCQQRGHTVTIGGSLYSDAMGPFGEFEGTYIGMVSSNVSKIVSALK